MYIAIDFDGTCVTHEYPDIGVDVGAKKVLKCLIKNGHKLILNTMRSGKRLKEAVGWFKDNGIELYGINENPTQKDWTNSPKVFASLYIDDSALGCPLTLNYDLCDRPFVNWKKVSMKLNKKGLITDEQLEELIQ